MIRLFFLIIYFLFNNAYALQAENPQAKLQIFVDKLDGIKDPFQDGIPKPAIVVPPPVYQPPPPRPKPVPKPLPPPVMLPELNVQGVMVGGDMHSAIINDKIVDLNGNIEGAKVIFIGQNGIRLLYKGKIFFLKVE